MAQNPIPSVIDGYLFLHDQAGCAASIQVGSHMWYSWLADKRNTSFSFRNYPGGFTARHERQRNGWYWYAYRKHKGKTYKAYLGKYEQLTQERLNVVAIELTRKSAVSVPVPSQSARLSGVQTLSAKFSVPSSCATLVARPRLLARLNAGMKGKLVLLSAPAGWGKTALLRTWCADLLRQEFPFAWITLDGDDNDPRVFWTNVITALDTVQPGIGDAALALLQGSQVAATEDVLKVLLNTLTARFTEDIVLILDEYHHIESKAVHQGLTFLLDLLPSHVHLVIAGRTYPPLSFAKLRVQGNLLELRAADLAFTLHETYTWLVEALELPFSRADCVVLTERTEGWAATLQLATLVMQDSGDKPAYLTTLTESNRHITDYLIEEVLLKQPPDVQDFLLHTSILTRLNGSLCDAVRECSGSQAMLERLEQGDLCIVTTDQQGIYYRYHHLFAEALRCRLHQMYPTSPVELQRRANAWYEQQGMVIENALSSAREARVERLLERQALSLVLRDQAQIVHDWFKMLPASEIPIEPLTERERDVLLLLINGASNREIANNLIISEGTVKKHVSNICSKLSVQRRTQAITKALSLALF